MSPILDHNMFHMIYIYWQCGLLTQPSHGVPMSSVGNSKDSNYDLCVSDGRSNR